MTPLAVVVAAYDRATGSRDISSFDSGGDAYAVAIVADAEKVQQLVALGATFGCAWDKDFCEKAMLATDNNIDAAAGWCLDNA